MRPAFRSQKVVTTVVFASLASLHASADVIVVDANGAGNFSQIQPAVDAAADGDTILIRSGAYGTFVVSDKELTIVGDTGADVQITGAVRCRNLSDGKTLVLENLIATGIVDGNLYTTSGLSLTNNRGHVRVEACEFSGLIENQLCCSVSCGSSYPAPCNTGLRCESTHDCVLTACMITGGQRSASSTGPEYAGPGGPGIDAIASALTTYDSLVNGGNGHAGSLQCGSYGNGGSGGHGCYAFQSDLFFSNSGCQGGAGGQSGAAMSSFDCVYGGDGGSGIYANLSGQHHAYLLTTSASGGPGGASGPGGCGPCSGSGSAGSPESGGNFIDVAGDARVMIVPTPVRELTSPELRFSGQPGDQVSLIVARHAQTAQYLPTWHGALVVEVTHPLLVINMGTIPASGSLHANLNLSDLGPGVQSRVYYLQSLFVDMHNHRHLGSPSCMVVLDSAF
jgi:hypothetical protein